MKKFIYLMAMVCTLGFFTACSSDDDDPTVWDTFKAGTYNVWGQELDTEDGEVDYKFIDFDMNIEKAGNQTAKVTLTDKSGEVTVNVPEATIIAQDGYTLRGQGTATINDNVTKATENANTMTVDFTAKISADYKNISVELKTADVTLNAGNSTEKPAVSKLLATQAGFVLIKNACHNPGDDNAEQGHEEAEQHVTGIPYTVKICSGHVLEQKYGQGDFIIE